MKGAVAAVAIAKAKDFLEEVIPGFGEQYRKHESRRNLLGSSYEHRGGNGPAENESEWQSSRRVGSEYAQSS